MQRHCFFLLLYCCSYVHKVCSILILILGESVGKDGLSPIEKNNDFLRKIGREKKLQNFTHMNESSNKIYKLFFLYKNKDICSVRMSARIRIKLSNDDITFSMFSIALIRHS